MHVVDPGHCYLFDGYDGALHQEVRFMKRIGDNYPGNIKAYGGTNCQELLRVLIDRVKYLDQQKPCEEDKLILYHLRNALYLFELRAFMRNREGKTWPQGSSDTIEDRSTCSHCGHISCKYLK